MCYEAWIQFFFPKNLNLFSNFFSGKGGGYNIYWITIPGGWFATNVYSFPLEMESIYTP